MNNYYLLAAFVISCAIISICLNKKQMRVVRAIFWAVGVYVAVCSAVMIYLSNAFGAHYANQMFLPQITSYLLLISTTVYNLVSLVVAVASIILAVLASQKFVEYFLNKRSTMPKRSAFTCIFSEEIPFFIKKLFLLHCRMLD